MKFFLFFLIVVSFSGEALSKELKFKKKLNNLKKQTVQIHNEILQNNEELKKIKVDIDRNKQKKIIFNKYIKDKEFLGQRIVFLLQDKFYTNQFTSILRNLNNSSYNVITKQIIREFFLKEIKVGINEYFNNLENLKDLDKELSVELENYKKKKKNLKKKLIKLEKKIKEVASLQKKVKPNKILKAKENNLRKKAKNLNELLKSAESKTKIISRIRSKIKMPVVGNIISNFGEDKNIHKLKNGLVFKVKED